MYMKTIEEIRVGNLLDIEERIGGREKLCDALDKEPKYISQLIGKTKNRNIGSRVAREIEEKLDLERGYLDNVQSGLTKEAVALAEKWLALPPKQRAVISGRLKLLSEVTSKSRHQ